MNILFVHNRPDLYGSSRSLLRLCTRLRKDGHGVSVALASDGPLGTALRSHGAKVEIIREIPLITRHAWKSPVKLLCWLAGIPVAWWKLHALLRREKPNILHSNVATILLVAGWAARSTGTRHIQHVRESFMEYPRLWPLLRKTLLAASDRILCVSHAIAQQFEPGTVTVLHNGFPREEFDEIAADRVAIFRKKFNVGGARLAGLVARINPRQKGQDTFLRAAAAVKDRFPGVHFVLIGSCFPGNENYLAEVQSLVHDLGLETRVTLTGDVEDIAAATAALDIAVLASHLPDSFPGSVIEAMAVGIPVIATRVGGAPEQVVDGRTGFLVPPGDASAMTDALAKLLSDDDLRRTMGAAGRQRFLDEFEFERFYGSLMEIYRDVTRT